MGSATKTTGGDSKKHRKQQRLRPKNPIGKKRTQDKNPPKKTKDKKKKKSSDENKNTVNSEAPKTARKREIAVAQWATASQQLSFFINQYESANRIQLSSLELDSLQGLPYPLFKFVITHQVLRNMLSELVYRFCFSICAFPFFSFSFTF